MNHNINALGNWFIGTASSVFTFFATTQQTFDIWSGNLAKILGLTVTVLTIYNLLLMIKNNRKKP